MHRLVRWAKRTTVISALALAGCAIPPPSWPVGVFPRERPQVPEPDAAAAAVPPGYRVEVFMKDLVWPTSVEFDDRGNVYVAEAGFAYGDPFAPAQVFRVSSAGEIVRLADQFMGPITDLLWHRDRLYVAHLGKISTVERDGSIRDLVVGLPSTGDHHNNQMTVGPDGKIYFGQGTATNSGVVGLDNVFPYFWLLLWPNLHDLPADTIRLRGETYVTAEPNNVLARQSNVVSLWDNLRVFMGSLFGMDHEKSFLVRTGAFQEFGVSGNEVVPGVVKANGTILRMNPDGSDLEVYAWGLRNPFGVKWGPDGRLYAAENGYDDRGSRPIANAMDNIHTIQQGAWYGFPDFSSGIPLTDPRFRSPRGGQPDFLLAEHPPLAPTWMTRPQHAGVTKLDFSTSPAFGFAGQMFLAEVGSGEPVTGRVPEPAGHMVVRIDPATQTAEPFFWNDNLGPEGLAYVTTPGPRRPVEAKFSPDGRSLYVTDVGVFLGTLAGAGPYPMPVPGTGVIWRVTPVGTEASGPSANLSPMPPRAHTQPRR